MARQSKDQTIKGRKYIGIDPGEAHVGWARLQVGRKRYILEVGTHSVADFGFASLIDALIPWKAATVCIEEYRARAVGHQRFNDGKTAQLIGALRYRNDTNNGLTRMVPTANPISELEKYKLFDLVGFIGEQRVEKGNPRWNHSLSALRVIAATMIQSFPTELYQLATGTFERMTESTNYDGDLSSGIINIFAK